MNIQLLNKDSYEWLKKQPDKSIDHMITDFVYGCEFPFEDAIRVCRGNVITFCAQEDEPFKPTERAYWIKTPSTKNYIKRLGRFVEKIYIYRQGDTFNCLHWSQMTGVYTDLVVDKEGHQWRKPLSLMERLVRIYTNEGDTVIDPFMGSGPTIEACRNLNRNCIGIDIDNLWVEYVQNKIGG